MTSWSIAAWEIRRKVIPLNRAHNGTEPDFEATEDYFKVTLWKGVAS